MPLPAGTRLGPYEVLAPISKGGMGEVYRAKDTRLKREVAVKVLPEAFATDRERMTRFQREAEVLASLNHPNIAQIYGIEDRALVMELVPGETLKGPLPLATALNYARQIAEALEAAHEKGIIHRDLKPANIIVTPEGVAKVLDFGLAAVLQGHSPAAVDPADSTVTTRPTEAGHILGTAGYMSPEQAVGKAVDRRADIWSFGAVLFEMLTGKRLFGGETVSRTLAQLLTGPIDLSTLPEATPKAVRELLRRCLNRDCRMRLSHIAEARILLQEFLANPAGEVAPATGARKGGWLVGAAVVLAFTAAVAGFGWWKATRALERPFVQLDVDPGAGYSGGEFILSPDGARLAFVSKGRLFTRRLNQSKATELAGTEGTYGPFFSPDGQWVAFFSGGKLKKISVESGAVLALCDAPSGRGGAWGEDHTIVAALTADRSPLMRIPDAGGAPQALTELGQDEVLHRWPQILPGGKAVLFTASTTTRVGAFDEAKIEVMTFQDGRRRTLQRGTYGRFIPATGSGPGHLVYITRGTLFAVPFDEDALEVRGTPVPVLQQVSYSPSSGFAQFDFSRDGTLVYRSGSEGGMVTLQWLSGGDKRQPLPAKPGVYSQPHLSPDGKLVALTGATESGTDIWIYDWQRDAMSRLTFGDGMFAFPVWSPDGRYLAFRSGSGILWTRADGTGKPQPLIQSNASQYPRYPWSFSPDGKWLAYADTGSGGFDLWTVRVENGVGGLRAGKPEVFLQTPANETYPAYSPDGRWIAYRSVEKGKAEIYVRAFPDNGGKWQISNSEGTLAIWSPNRRELFYLTPQQQIMAVSYTTSGDSFLPEKPRLWAKMELAGTAFHQNLDISPDGKRFVVLMSAEGQPANNHVIFLQNFSDEIRRRAAGGQ